MGLPVGGIEVFRIEVWKVRPSTEGLYTVCEGLGCFQLASANMAYACLTVQRYPGTNARKIVGSHSFAA